MLDRVERRLAAILAADVVGYSRLIGENEGETLRRLKELRRSVVDPIIKQHQGRIVKTTGDGILIEFPSAVEAVRCALKVQHTIAEAQGKALPDSRITFRVGIHQGDVVVENNDLFGDGVNVAARLEGLSEAGGICISSRVHEDTVGRLELPFEDRGEQQVKNIKRPVHVYALGRDVISSLPRELLSTNEPSNGGLFSRGYGKLSPKWPRTSGLLLAAAAIVGFGIWLLLPRYGSTEQASATQPRGPTVAVLPFDNLSGEPSQEPFSEAISDDLITVLGRFSQLHVLARDTTFTYKGKSLYVTDLGRKFHAQYIIQGSFQSAPDQMTVTVRLVDAQTGTQVWAHTYEQSPASKNNILEIQDQISARAGAAIGDPWTGAVAGAELKKMENKATAELTSYECVLQGDLANKIQTLVKPMQRARECLEATVKRDPSYAEAWAIFTRVLTLQRFYGTGLPAEERGDPDKRAYLVPRIVEAGNRAVELAPESAQAHLALLLSYYATCQPERMRIEAERVLSINPNDATALGVMGNELAFAGEWDYGVKLAEKGIALAGPAAPRWWWWAVAKDYYHKGDYANAFKFFERSYVEQNWLDHLHIVYTLPYLGRTDEARAQIPALLKLKPDMTVRQADELYKMWCFSADFRKRMTTALSLAGLREK